MQGKWDKVEVKSDQKLRENRDKVLVGLVLCIEDKEKLDDVLMSLLYCFCGEDLVFVTDDDENSEKKY